MRLDYIVMALVVLINVLRVLDLLDLRVGNYLDGDECVCAFFFLLLAIIKKDFI